MKSAAAPEGAAPRKGRYRVVQRAGASGFCVAKCAGWDDPWWRTCHTRQIVERCEIAGHDGALRCARRRSNDEVVGTARGGRPDVRRRAVRRVRSDRSVVGEDRNDVAHVVDEPLALCSSSPRCQACAILELGDGDCRDCDVVVVADCLVELSVGPFGVDEECGVEQQQGRSSLIEFDQRADLVERRRPLPVGAISSQQVFRVGSAATRDGLDLCDCAYRAG